MCIITTEEFQELAENQRLLKINNTSIFARHSRPDHQLLIYQLSISSNRNAAMILPLPVSSHLEEALIFHDLSGYDDFFDDLAAVCEPEVNFLSAAFAGLSEDFSLDRSLKVHDVGDFEASYVPSMKDFERLDPRFRMSDEIWKKMPDYSDYGFAVFQLKIQLSREAENKVHPMAFEFPTKTSQELFFPTVHVHDGDYHQQANFHHTLYCQSDGSRSEFKYQRDLLEGKIPSPAIPTIHSKSTSLHPGYEWFMSSKKIAKKCLDMKKYKNIIDPNKKIYAMNIIGNFLNQDIWLGNQV